MIEVPDLIVLNYWVNSTERDIQDQVPLHQALLQCRGRDQGHGEVPRVSLLPGVSRAPGGCQCLTAGRPHGRGERRREEEECGGHQHQGSLRDQDLQAEKKDPKAKF